MADGTHSLTHPSKGPHEDPRVPGQGDPASISACPCRAAFPRSLFRKPSRRRRSWAAPCGSSRRRSTPAAAARAAASRSPSRIDRGQGAGRARSWACSSSHAPDRPRRPEGAPPVHRGRRRHPEGTTTSPSSPIARRRRWPSSLPAKAAWTSRRWPTATPEKIITVFDRPADRHDRRPGQAAGRRPSASRPTARWQAVDVFKPSSTPATCRPTPVAGGDQPAQPRRQGQHHRPGRQVQLRQQRAVPPPRHRGPARSGRGRSGRDRGQ
jgi:hypothetical protein